MDLNLSKIIEKVLDSRALDEPRDYVGASSIGNDCTRAIWYQSKGTQPIHINHRTKRIFDTGKILETLLIDYIEQSTIKVIRPSEDNNWLYCHDNEYSFFAGHMDAILVPQNDEPIILDIKTCKHEYFGQFKSQGLQFWNPTYYAQLQAYMGMTGYKKACLLAYNKNDQNLHDETVSFDEVYYASLKEKARAIFQSTEPPEKINRSPLYYKCGYCSYKEVCHA